MIIPALTTNKNPWWKALSRYQWLVLLIAWLGWVFDIMDTALFNFAKGPMLNELYHGTPGERAYAESFFLTVLLIGWSAGGLLFGILADRWGRVRTLTVTVLIYCLFTGATALCRSWQEVAAIRFVTALGIGGEWAAGAALLAEAFPDKARAPGASLLQSAAAFGPWFAALINLGIAPENWRWLFLVGIVPAAMTVVLRLGVHEPEKWVTAETRKPSGQEEAHISGSAGRLESALPTAKSKLPISRFSRPNAEGGMPKAQGLFLDPTWRKHAIIALVLGVCGIAAANNISFWLPNLTKAVSEGSSPAAVQQRVSYVTLAMHVGTLIGVFLAPWLCERIGRKRALATFFICSPISVGVVASFDHSYMSLIVLAPLMSLFTIGMSAGFVLYFPELFPTRLRATGAGFAYNTGRILAAGVPLLTAAWIGSTNSVIKGVALTALVPLVGLIALGFAPETKGMGLPD